MKTITRANVEEMLARLGYYYKRSLTVSASFGGPSVYFHGQCVEAARTDFLSEKHIEYVYATLGTWGLHRMGETATKMVDWADFRASIEDLRDDLLALRQYKLVDVSSDTLDSLLADDIHKVFMGIRVSASKALLVGNSKGLHHILPNLVPPIDRQYTLRFFYYPKDRFLTVSKGKLKWRLVDLPADRSEQYEIFQLVNREIWRIIHASEFQRLDLDEDEDAPMNTSRPKIVDNLIIAYVQDVR